MPNVLIVDDDEDISEMVSLILKTNGINSSRLDDGNHLFEWITSLQPDIILMDIYLGNNDGRVLCRDLKNMENFKHIPVVLYSAGNITTQSIRESLADDFITKPFVISTLLEKIKSRVFTRLQ
jgi:DNA-binding response OmpR family regulator